ncbi:sizzled [Callorhinchus milii]|uniref:sizzled n=1 Tax=Callorhinchus milii TaxID=7868 RepID=UPI000457162D|nr:sizzled [Callorhinchus milii]|eukprot:gi/632947616/ref/XP_007889136.1/ PREDICTED: secreted frizzled-related protein 2-like [Callorhinchus milii]
MFVGQKRCLFASYALLHLVVTAVQCFDIGISTKCVAIPEEMGLCQDVGYSEMRLPNLMGHTTLGEVIPKSAAWESLLRTGCHSEARTFLCALFAPICLDTFIQPCRSMCTAVRNSCLQVLTCHGHSWPEALDCDRFPADEDTCLTSISKETPTYRKFFPKPICQGCPVTEELSAHKRVLQTFCQNNFAVKVKLAKRKSASGDSELEIDGRVEMISSGSLFPFGTHTIIQQWLLINTNCAHKMMRGNRVVQYVLIGDVQDSNIIVNKVYLWHRKDTQLMLAARKWKQHKC